MYERLQVSVETVLASDLQLLVIRPLICYDTHKN